MSFRVLPMLYRFPAPTCAAGCDTNLPVWVFDDCNPKINLSEIKRIFMAKRTAASFTNYKLAAEWMTRISTGGNDPDAIRVLTVIADKPAGTSVVKEISNGRKQLVGKDQVLNFTIDDVSDSNYNAMRQLECGGNYKFWFETEGGYLYGGNEGIIASVDVNSVNGRGRDEIEVINGSFSWRNKFSPERTPSPIFGTGFGTQTVTTFDSLIAFTASATPAAVAAITGTTVGTDPDQKFEFNAITNPSGVGFSMSITVSGTEECTIDGPSDYVGTAFRYTTKAGIVHIGTIIDGVVAY